MFFFFLLPALSLSAHPRSRWRDFLRLLSNRETVFLWFCQRVPEAGSEKGAQWKHCGVCQQPSACLQLGRLAELPPSNQS